MRCPHTPSDRHVRQNRLANRVFDSYDAIVTACCDAWNALVAIPERVASITSRVWAQVNGWRGETDTLEKMEKRIEHDLDYIRGWSLIWDLKIIFLTVFGSAVRRNAY